MREVNFLVADWLRSFHLLQQGKSVMICAPERYGKQFFIDHLLNSDDGDKTLKSPIIIYDIYDDKNLDFQKILNQFQNSYSDSCYTANNKFDFINCLESILTNKKAYFIIIRNSYKTVNNVATLIDILDEIYQRNLYKLKNRLRILVTDDYSLYYYERKTWGENSRWLILERLYLRQLEETKGIVSWIKNSIDNEDNTSIISKKILEVSGGHHGIIIELCKSVLLTYNAIKMSDIDDELKYIASTSKVFDSLNNLISSLSGDEVKYLYSFKVKKLIESSNQEIIKKYHQKGLLQKSEFAYIKLIDGLPREIIKIHYNAKNNNTMNNKKLALFIHGLDGAASTWEKINYYFKKDSELMTEYDSKLYVFPTSKFWQINFFKSTIPPIQQLADGLKTEIEVKYRDYKEIVLICHSLGGLVGRKYMLNSFLHTIFSQKITEDLRVKRIIMYATPNNGAALASVGKYIAFRNKQVKQLCKNSEFIEELNQTWATCGIQNKIDSIFLIGAMDQIVEKKSVQMYWGNEKCSTIIDADHFTIIKPSSKNSLSFLILKQFLLDIN